jgi:hypothetical protein
MCAEDPPDHAHEFELGPVPTNGHGSMRVRYIQGERVRPMPVVVSDGNSFTTFFGCDERHGIRSLEEYEDSLR